MTPGGDTLTEILQPRLQNLPHVHRAQEPRRPPATSVRKALSRRVPKGSAVGGSGSARQELGIDEVQVLLDQVSGDGHRSGGVAGAALDDPLG